MQKYFSVFSFRDLFVGNEAELDPRPRGSTGELAH